MRPSLKWAKLFFSSVSRTFCGTTMNFGRLKQTEYVNYEHSSKFLRLCFQTDINFTWWTSQSGRWPNWLATPKLRTSPVPAPSLKPTRTSSCGSPADGCLGTASSLEVEWFKGITCYISGCQEVPKRLCRFLVWKHRNKCATAVPDQKQLSGILLVYAYIGKSITNKEKIHLNTRNVYKIIWQKAKGDSYVTGQF